jgi:hypothetical protein
MRSVPHELEIERQEESLEKISVRGLRRTVTGFLCMGIAALMSVTSFGAVNQQPSGSPKFGVQKVRASGCWWGDWGGCSVPNPNPLPGVLGVRG